MTCPKCGAARPVGVVECPECGIIYARVEQKRERRQQETQARQEQQQARRESLRNAAMLDCPLCGKRISRLAPTCPHCGHPIAGTVPVPDLGQPTASKTKRNVYIGLGVFLLLCTIIPMFGGGGDGKFTGKPSPEAAPGTPSTPRAVTISASAFGCRDIGDFWLMVTEAKKGDAQHFSRVMNKYADEGKCDMVKSGAATALEFLPAGAVRIRDANNALWWVSDASVRL